MLGTQTNSVHHSSPSYGFGSSTREQANKVFVSHEHSKLATSGVSPGPASLGARSTCGPQVDGTYASAPMWNFSSAKRFGVYGRDNVPGPGKYEMRSSMGPQVEGDFPTLPVFGMGSSTRDNVKRVYISEQHSNVAFQGANSPGPASYSLNTSVGKQGSSTKANQPSWVFGSNKRFTNPDLLRSARQPGPDQYDAHSAIGPQVASTKRSAPLAGFGSSNRMHASKVFMSPQHVSVQFLPHGAMH